MAQRVNSRVAHPSSPDINRAQLAPLPFVRARLQPCHNKTPSALLPLARPSRASLRPLQVPSTHRATNFLCLIFCYRPFLRLISSQSPCRPRSQNPLRFPPPPIYNPKFRSHVANNQ